MFQTGEVRESFPNSIEIDNEPKELIEQKVEFKAAEQPKMQEQPLFTEPEPKPVVIEQKQEQVPVIDITQIKET